MVREGRDPSFKYSCIWGSWIVHAQESGCQVEERKLCKTRPVLLEQRYDKHESWMLPSKTSHLITKTCTPKCKDSKPRFAPWKSCSSRYMMHLSTAVKVILCCWVRKATNTRNHWHLASTGCLRQSFFTKITLGYLLLDHLLCCSACLLVYIVFLPVLCCSACPDLVLTSRQAVVVVGSLTHLLLWLALGGSSMSLRSGF